MHQPMISTSSFAAVSVAILLCAPAVAQTGKADTVRKMAVEKVAVDKANAARPAEPRKKVSSSQSNSAAPLKADTLGSFTPPMVEALRKGPVGGTASLQERTFRFTPSGKVNDGKALTLGVTSRVVRAVAPETARAAETEVASVYNFDVSVGYRGFAITGGISKLDSVLSESREGVDLGLSYRGNRWKTALQLNAQRDGDGWINPLSLDKEYSVELGGAYALSSRFSVMGGVRYQLMQADPASRYLLRNEQKLGEAEAGAVYLGTSISF